MTAILVIRPESFPTGNSGDITVSVQEVVYGVKEAGVGTSSNPLHMHNELLYSSEEFHGPRKESRPSKGLETHIFQRTSKKDKSLVEKTKHFVRGPEERVGPKEGQQGSGSSSSLHKQGSATKSAKQGKVSPKEK
ncbi:hypothetical protein O181_001913 [Austropuccinia psidii MF-1]|uniref:Uncharacterized protein n=1 Tax=Austropuccinia psidii MF-1 TaxID=1389203 RepID=A0A9Q3BBF6_9BASI|nr:hypothetical protein [Austropuccinia psidii MF-1]